MPMHRIVYFFYREPLGVFRSVLLVYGRSHLLIITRILYLSILLVKRK